jgi:hypothetical protein
MSATQNVSANKTRQERWFRRYFVRAGLQRAFLAYAVTKPFTILKNEKLNVYECPKTKLRFRIILTCAGNTAIMGSVVSRSQSYSWFLLKKLQGNGTEYGSILECWKTFSKFIVFYNGLGCYLSTHKDVSAISHNDMSCIGTAHSTRQRSCLLTVPSVE